MKPTEINVSVRFVKNLGNYQSFAAEAAVTAVIDPDESPTDAFNEAWKLAKEQVKSQLTNAKEVGQ